MDPQNSEDAPCRRPEVLIIPMTPRLCSTTDNPLVSPLTSGTPTSPTGPLSPLSPTSPQAGSPSKDRCLSLSSPELLSELKTGRTLRHVSHSSGLTRVFSGRGRANRPLSPDFFPPTTAPPPASPPGIANGRRGEAGSMPLPNGMGN
ncbi:espin-like isoform X2 [Lepisosteus oculatus]|nr:PREDICTED: espin-like isoform X2 [Lepisosteus oculatus]